MSTLASLSEVCHENRVVACPHFAGQIFIHYTQLQFKILMFGMKEALTSLEDPSNLCSCCQEAWAAQLRVSHIEPCLSHWTNPCNFSQLVIYRLISNQDTKMRRKTIIPFHDYIKDAKLMSLLFKNRKKKKWFATFNTKKNISLNHACI